MHNKFKVKKKKIISIALALVLAAQPLCAFPMSVFAGNAFAGKKKVAFASDFDIDNIIELNVGQCFDASDYVKNITPQGAAVSCSVESQTVFADDGDVLCEGRIQKPGIAKVKVEVGGVYKYTYIVASVDDISHLDGILNDSFAVADAATYVVASLDFDAPIKALYAACHAAGYAGGVDCPFNCQFDWGRYHPFISGGDISTLVKEVFKVVDADGQLKKNVGDDLANVIVTNYQEASYSLQIWLKAAYAAVKVLKIEGSCYRGEPELEL